MDNGTNLSKEQLSNILSKAKQLSDEGKVPDNSLLGNQLTPSQTEKLKGILGDPQKLSEIMNSPMAKKLISMLNAKNKE